MIIPDRRKTASVIVSGLHGEEVSNVHPDQGAHDLEETKLNIGNDFLHAIKINSGKALFQAFEAAFALLESQPHNEADEE